MALWLGMMRLAERAGLVQVLAASDPATDAAPLSRSPSRASGHGRDDDEHGLQHARHWQRRDSAWPPCHARFATTQSDQGHCFERDVHFPCDQHQLDPAHSGQPDRNARSGWFGRPTAIIGTALVATTVSTVVGIVSVKLLEKLRWFRIPAQAAAPPTGEGPLQTIVGATEDVASSGAGETPPQSRLPELRWCGKALLILFAAFFVWLFFNMTFASDRLKPGGVRAILCEQGIRGNLVEGTILSETSSNLVLRSADGVTNAILKQHPKYCPKAGDIKAQLQFDNGALSRQ